MMRIVAAVAGILLVLLGALYALLFTPPGNRIVAPLVEEQIHTALDAHASLERFELRWGDFDVTLALTPNNRVSASGSYALFTQSIDATYALNLDALEELASLTERPLYGGLKAKGSIAGNPDQLVIDGTSDIGQSDTRYHAVLTDFAPASLEATVKHASTEALQRMLGEAVLLRGALDLDARLGNLDPQHLEGVATLRLHDGSLDRRTISRDYGVELPDAGFSAQADALLEGKQITYDLDVASALARITSKGKMIPETVGMDLTYDLYVRELALLDTLTPIPMRGPFATRGTVKGDRAKSVVSGSSDLAGGDTRYTLTLEAFAPRALTATVKDAEVARVLHMLAQPHYSDGRIAMTVDLPDARTGSLQGTVSTRVSEGQVDGAVFSKQFDLGTMPKTRFTADTVTTLKDNRATTRTRVASTLADVSGEAATVDFDTGHVRADYKVTVHDLDALYFVTERHLEGSVVLIGNLSVADALDVTAHSDTLGGSIDVTMHNDDIHADFKQIRTLDALKMLRYPEIFKAAMKGTFDYNVLAETGRFESDFSDGHFTRNSMLDLLRQFTGIDLYGERFTGKATGTIAKSQILSDVDLRANTSSIRGKKIALDTQTRRIDAKLDVVANNNPAKVRVKGDIDAPKVEVDASKALQNEINKRLEKEAGKLLKNLF